MGDYGAAVSRVGIDVKTAADKDMLFKPTINMLKVSAQGTASVTNGTTWTFAHGLGYLPNFFILGENTGGSGKYYWITATRPDLGLVPYADSTNVKVRNYNAATCALYYYVFIDPA